MRIPFRLVDVFTDRPLAGNQLCVVPEPMGLPTDLMQALALEIGFSETTFVTEAAGGRYAMRIFTPGAELPFAGHPSVGTAFVLVSEGRVSSPVTQVVAAGEFTIEVDVERGWSRMRQSRPTFGPRVDDREALAAAVGLGAGDLAPGLPAELVSTGFGHLILALRDTAAVGRARRDAPGLEPILESLGTDAVYVFALEEAAGEEAGGARAKARLFARGIGIDEDPATGSAAGPLGAYLVEHGVLAPGRLTVSQGEEIGRPSTIVVDVEAEGEGSWRVLVGGGVAVVGRGEFELPG